MEDKRAYCLDGSIFSNFMDQKFLSSSPLDMGLMTF